MQHIIDLPILLMVSILVNLLFVVGGWLLWRQSRRQAEVRPDKSVLIVSDVCPGKSRHTAEIELDKHADTASDLRDASLMEKFNRIRLDLWEYAPNHSLEALMQRALDAICDLTDSPIGFYHLVNEDQNTLSLKAWSSRTRAEYCTASGDGSHYPISEAGVWVECFYQRKPVIHNDYAALVHKKGLPPGHAPLLRELVTPTLRNERVMSILGIGNKATEYTEHDVRMIEQIADLTWTIIEHKHAIDQISRLNARLEVLAMRDALTGLYNRRAFFQRAEEELQRFMRYQSELSLLMFDIDHFKLINDTYGHACGDIVLGQVAATLRTIIREVDISARIGGEEFAVLLPNTSLEQALHTAERIRLMLEQPIAQMPNVHEQPTLMLTVSIGVTSFHSDLLNLDDAMREADHAMYQAKHGGRNRVVCFQADRSIVPPMLQRGDSDAFVDHASSPNQNGYHQC